MPRKSIQYIWMAVTRDERETVVYFADTAEELASLVGNVKVGTIKDSVYRPNRHSLSKSKKLKFIRVVIEDEGLD